ncbi:MAG: hypothetical protein EP343_11415 [Deltaproteobacteria bacterium]|nr:MAG: hypothetical protein EP343_11415 [Deltaproteobacteria bacterium]
MGSPSGTTSCLGARVVEDHHLDTMKEGIRNRHTQRQGRRAASLLHLQQAFLLHVRIPNV